MEYNFEKHDKEEKIFLKQIYDNTKKVVKNNTYYNTEFLDLYQLKLVENMLKKIKVQYHIFDYDNLLERKIISINKENIDNIQCLKITPKIKNSLLHKDYMGALYNFGINISMIGDIFIIDDTCYLFTINKISDYIIDNLNYIKNSEVIIEKINYNDLDIKKQFIEKNIYTSSLRIDTIISKIYNLSRTDAAKKILKKEVIVNSLIITSKTKELNINDIVAVRGSGKFILNNYYINKKDKYVITINLYK